MIAMSSVAVPGVKPMLSHFSLLLPSVWVFSIVRSAILEILVYQIVQISYSTVLKIPTLMPPLISARCLYLRRSYLALWGIDHVSLS